MYNMKHFEKQLDIPIENRRSTEWEEVLQADVWCTPMEYQPYYPFPALHL